MVKTISTPRKINTILFSIKVNQPKLIIMCGCKLAKKMAKCNGNILSPSENIAKSFGGYFFDSQFAHNSEYQLLDLWPFCPTPCKKTSCLAF